MIKINKADIEPQAFQKLFTKLDYSISSINSNLHPKEYSNKVFEIMRGIFGPNYIIVQSTDIYYNIQSEPYQLLIMTIGDIRVVAYKPRSLVKPVKRRSATPADDMIKIFIRENKAPNVEELNVLRNSLVAEKDLKDIKNYIAIYLNKNKEQEKYLHQFLPEMKSFLVPRLGKGIYHFFLTDNKSTHIQTAEDTDLYNETSELQIELKLVKDKKRYMLYVFENKGNTDRFFIRCLRAWKDFLAYLFLFLLVSVITVCRETEVRFISEDVQFICQNKYPLMFILSVAIISLVIAKYRRPNTILKNNQEKKLN